MVSELFQPFLTLENRYGMVLAVEYPRMPNSGNKLDPGGFILRIGGPRAVCLNGVGDSDEVYSVLFAKCRNL